MDKKKILLWATGSLFGIALLALLVLWIAVKVNERKVYGGGGSGVNTDGGSSGGSSPLPTFPLRRGCGSSSSSDPVKAKKYVRYVQIICNKWTAAGLVKDGIWGEKTEAAVRSLKSVKGAVPITGTGAITTPFPSCISESNTISLQNYTEMANWHNSHYKRYKAL